jgi:hypothetical protein
MPERPPSSREPSSSRLTTETLRAGAFSRALIALVRAYRLLAAPALPPACRFTPSCSSFAIEAVDRHGPWRGVRLALGRLARCHPWHPGGYDPVPSAGEHG